MEVRGGHERWGEAVCDRPKPFGLIAQGTDVGGDGVIMAAAVAE